MTRVIRSTLTMLCCALVCSSCATSPDAGLRREATRMQIEEILSIPLDEEEYGVTKRCLSSNEYRDFRALDDRHILFEGRRGKYWINTLRTRCPDLQHGTVLIVRSYSTMGRLCDADRFEASDWFSWPWYRRWPWDWRTPWWTGMSCSLGKFQPVTEDQVNAIKQAIKSK